MIGVLSSNITLNKLDSVNTFDVAFSSKTGRATFHKNISSPLLGSLSDMFVEAHDTVAIDVETISYQDFAKAQNLTRALVKVDVENAELEFISGIGDQLHSIEFLVIELLKTAHEKQIVSRLIKEFALYAYYIDDYQIRSSLDGSFKYKAPEYNWLFCRYSPTELQSLLPARSKLRVCS